jgi:hypothetical protein
MEYTLFHLSPVLDIREVCLSCNENVESVKVAVEAMNTNIKTKLRHVNNRSNSYFMSTVAVYVCLYNHYVLEN